MSKNADILIIGAGIIGLSIARELGLCGVGRVAVVERGRVGGGASWAAAGMLSPNAECERVDEFYRFCEASRRMYPEFSEELQAETGIDVELDRSGTLYAAFTEEDLAHLELRHARQAAAGIRSERLSPEETLKREPRLATDVRASLLFPDDWQVENRLVLKALLASAAGRGVEIKERSTVDSLIEENGRVLGAVVNGDRVLAAITVLATGAWTSLIRIGSVPVPFKIRPVRGQMLCFRPPARPFSRVVYSPRGYVVPRADGRILVGATVEDVGFDDSVTDSGISCLKTAAAEIAPLLAKEDPIDSWSGLRPFATDGLPVLGPVDGYEGLVVATAHYRNGILLAPATAKLMADHIVDGSGPEEFVTYSPRRLFDKRVNASA
jgi:glycine oxidase